MTAIEILFKSPLHFKSRVLVLSALNVHLAILLLPLRVQHKLECKDCSSFWYRSGPRSFATLTLQIGLIFAMNIHTLFLENLLTIWPPDGVYECCASLVAVCDCVRLLSCLSLDFCRKSITRFSHCTPVANEKQKLESRFDTTPWAGKSLYRACLPATCVASEHQMFITENVTGMEHVLSGLG